VLKRLGRDVAIYGSADFVFKLLQFLAVPLYSHRLSVSDFGLLSLVTVSTTLVGILANLGIGYALYRFYYDADISDARRPVLVTTGLVQLLAVGSLVLTLLGFGLFQSRDYFRAEYQLPWSFMLVGLLTILPDQVAQYSLDISRLQLAPWRFCAIAMIKNVLGLVIGLWLLFGRDLGVLGLLLGNLAAALLAVPLGLWLIRRDLTREVDRAFLMMLLRFGSPFVLTAAAYWMFASVDRWLLAWMSDTVQVGLFSIALKFASVMTLLITAFHQAWVPIAMRMARDEPEYRTHFGAIFGLWLFLLSLIALGLALFAHEAMMLLTPESYWPAATALALTGCALALSGTTQITTLGMTLEKRTGLIAIGAWLTACLNILLNVMLIPRYGAIGSVIATLVSYAFLTTYFLFWSQRLHPIDLPQGRLIYGLSVLATATAVSFLDLGEPFSPVAVALKACILIAAVLGAVPAGLIDPNLLRQIAPRTRKVAS